MRTLNNYFYCLYIVLFLSGVFILSSCRSRKETTVVAISERNETELIRLITSNAIQYNSLSARANVYLKFGQKNKSVSAPTNLRIIKGEAIQMSFQIPILNAELFRMTITPDSILLIDRTHKIYFAESLEKIKAEADFAFDYYNLESLFTNQLFIAGQPVVTTDNYRSLSVEQTQYYAYIRSKDRKNIAYTFTCDYTDRIRKTDLESENKKTRMTWSYDEFGPITETCTFPMKMKMNLQLPSDEASMELAYSKVDLNKDFSVEFKIPDKYNRMTLLQIIRMIENL